MRKICFVTGTRAEYGLLSRLMRLVKDDEDMQLQVIATNMHLMPEYGETYKEIEKDGFTIDKKVYMHKPSDDAHGIISSMAEEMQGMNDALSELKPDILVLLGDRYEILVAAQVALIHRIPIAHIHGGEVTEGAFDDAIRHSVTKMSSLHFTSCEEYRHRVIQLGEQPSRVFNVGALGVENIKKFPLMSKTEVEESVNFKLDENTILVTYHPVTLGEHTTEKDIKEFIAALEERKNLRVFFTMPNSDTGSQAIVDAINEFVANNADRSIAYKSLGIKRYLSVMKYTGAVVGNSSSGLLEVPSFCIPTLNIGDRQKGRMAADSVYNCETDKESILKGLEVTMSPAFKKKAAETHNPYEKANTAEEIFEVISTYPLEQLKQKQFYNL